MSTSDKAAPGVRISIVESERGPTGERVDFGYRFLGIVFEDTEKKADKMSITLDNTDLALFDCAQLMSGAMLEVTWGFPGQTAPPRRVVVQKIKGFQTLTLEALATSAEMAKRAKTRSWRGKTRSEVAEEVAREYGYVGDFIKLESTTIQMDTISQRAETDAAFLRRLANLEGFQFYVDDTGLHFHKRDQSKPPTHVMRYYADGDCDILSVNCEADLLRRSGAVQVVGRDPLTKKLIDATADAANTERDKLGQTPLVMRKVDDKTGATTMATLPRTPATPRASADPEAASTASGGTLGSLAALFSGSSANSDARAATANQRATSAKTAEQAQREAAARFTKSEREAIKLTLKVNGDPTLRAKEVIEVLGISALLSGKYFITEAKHVLNSSSYTVELKLTKDSRGGGAGAGGAKKADAGKVNREAKPEEGKKQPIRMIDAKTGTATMAWKGGTGSPDPEGKH